MFYVFCSEKLTHKRRLKVICSVEPTDEELKKMWDDFNLKTIAAGSDLIEVFEEEQIQEEFNISADSLEVEEVYIPNKKSKEDAINAYFP